MAMTTVRDERVREFVRHLQCQGFTVPSEDVLDLLVNQFHKQDAMFVRIDELEYALEDKVLELDEERRLSIDDAQETHGLLQSLLDELAEVCAYDPDEEREPEEIAAQFEEIASLVRGLRTDVLTRLADMTVERA